MNYKRNVKLFLCIFPIVLMCLPLMDMGFNIAPAIEVNENRNLAASPSLHLLVTEPTQFRKLLETYFNDNFGFRKHLIFANSLIKYKLFSTSVNSRIAIGDSGWLYLVDAEKDVRGFQPFNNKELEEWKTLLEYRSQWLKTRNIQYLFVIAPSKNTLYPQHLPAKLEKQGTSNRLDQLIAYLKNNSTVSILDLRDPLQAASHIAQTYYRKDLHWNNYGGFTAAQNILKRVAHDNPSFTPYQKSDYSIEMQQRTRYPDLAGMLSLQNYLGYDDEVNVLLNHDMANRTSQPLFNLSPGINTRISDTTNRHGKLVMFHDSFGIAPFYYLANQFSRIYAVETGEMQFYPQIIERESPSYVIDLILEAKLANPLAASLMDYDRNANTSWESEFNDSSKDVLVNIKDYSDGVRSNIKLSLEGTYASCYIIKLKISSQNAAMMTIKVESPNTAGVIEQKTFVRPILAGETFVYLPFTGGEANLVYYFNENTPKDVQFMGARARTAELIDESNILQGFSGISSDNWTTKDFSWLPRYNFDTLKMKFNVNKYILPNKLTVVTENETKIIELNVGSNEIVLPYAQFYRFHLDKAFVPKQAGLSNDVRELGVFVESANTVSVRPDR